jgi:hypothetical protein
MQMMHWLRSRQQESIQFQNANVNFCEQLKACEQEGRAVPGRNDAASK